jgi:hemolysin activation/secretion protein
MIQNTFRCTRSIVEARCASHLNHLLPLLTTLALLPGTALAQAGVDAGSLLRETQQAPSAIPSLPATEIRRAPTTDTGVKVAVKAFVVTGSTRFDRAVWGDLLKDFVGQEIGFGGLQAVADRVSLHYRQAGLHALAFLPEQSLAGGVVQIVVSEGRLGELRFDTQSAAKRLPASLLKKMLARGQEAGQIVNVDALERATLIANDMPGLKISSVLSAGKEVGTTDILVQTEPLPVLAGNVSSDNADPRSTGQFKTSALISLSNAFSVGEQVLLSAQASEGKSYGQLAYSQPLAANGLRGGFNVSRLDYKLLDSFAATGGKGYADTWGANLSYPLIRSQQSNLNGQLTYSQSRLVTDSDVAGSRADKKSKSTTLGLSGNANDSFAGGGVSVAGISVATGNVDVAGDFSKLQLNIARLQRLSGTSMLWFSANGQLAFNNLDSGEKFTLGGPNAVRAYPALEAAGDLGMVVTAEYRHDFSNQLRGKAFYDWGNITINRNAIAAQFDPNNYSLQGVGVGLDWSPQPQFSLRATLAWRVGDNPAARNGNDSDGTKRLPQFWLSANFDF